MKSLPRAAGIGFLLTCLVWRVAAENAADPVAKYFYPPGLVRMTREALKLTEEQQAALQEALEQAHSRSAEFQARLNGARQKLEDLVKADKLDEEAVLKQAGRVMDLERDLKMAQVVLLVKIRSTLTLEQQTKLKELKEKTAGFQAKVRQAVELEQKWKEEGRDTSAFDRAREEFEALMTEGDFKAVEMLLDKTLKRLQEAKDKK